MKRAAAITGAGTALLIGLFASVLLFPKPANAHQTVAVVAQAPALVTQTHALQMSARTVIHRVAAQTQSTWHRARAATGHRGYTGSRLMAPRYGTTPPARMRYSSYSAMSRTGSYGAMSRYAAGATAHTCPHMSGGTPSGTSSTTYGSTTGK